MRGSLPYLYSFRGKEKRDIQGDKKAYWGIKGCHPHNDPIPVFGEESGGRGLTKGPLEKRRSMSVAWVN